MPNRRRTSNWSTWRTNTSRRDTVTYGVFYQILHPLQKLYWWAIIIWFKGYTPWLQGNRIISIKVKMKQQKSPMSKRLAYYLVLHYPVTRRWSDVEMEIKITRVTRPSQCNLRIFDWDLLVLSSWPLRSYKKLLGIYTFFVTIRKCKIFQDITRIESSRCFPNANSRCQCLRKRHSMSLYVHVGNSEHQKWHSSSGALLFLFLLVMKYPCKE